MIERDKKLLQKRVSPTEKVFQKVVEPSLGSFRAIPHASHWGVRYHPSLVSPSAPSVVQSRAATEPEASTLPKIQLKTRMTRSAVGIGDEKMMPVYIPCKDDTTNLQRSATPNSFRCSFTVPWSFHSTTRLKQVPLPQVKSQELGRSTSPRGIKNISISGDRYLGSTLSQPTKPRTRSHTHTGVPKTQQVRRFEEELSTLQVTRTMKRKSEMLSHRMDRMYYMCGSSLPVRSKYLVDEEELEKLRELSRTRNAQRISSGHSSTRSRLSLAESSLISESVGQGFTAPHASERHTPLSRADTVDLSIQGNGVGMQGDEVKGHSTSKQDHVEGGAGPDGDVNKRICSADCQDKGTDGGDAKYGDDGSGGAHTDQGGQDKLGQSGHADEESGKKTHPHRTTDDGSDQQDANDEVNTKKSNGEDGESGIHGNKGGEEHGDAADDVDGDDNEQGKRLEDAGGDSFPSASGADGQNCAEDSGTNGAVGGTTGGALAGAEGTTNAGDDTATGGGNGDDGGVEGTSVDDDAVTGGTTQGTDGDGDGDEGGKAEETEEGSMKPELAENSETSDTDGRHVKSIGPSMSIDKTPFSMSKQDVYLTEFGDPKLAQLKEILPSTGEDGDDDDGDENLENGTDAAKYKMNTRESEIEGMERSLLKVERLTKDVDDVGHLSESDYNPEEFESQADSQEDAGDTGVFAKAKSDDEIRKAQQLKREKREAKIAANAARQEEEAEIEAARQKRDKKKNAEPQFKISDVYNFISPRQRAIFTQKFRELDTDKNGKITLKELTRKMHKWVAKDEIKHLMKVFDLNKDKTIDEREFVTVAALNDKLTGREIASEDAPLELNLDKLSWHITSYKEMFEVVDQNQDGRLSIEEIMTIVSLSAGIEIGTDKEIVQHIYDTIDRDDNGTIDFIEFLSYIPFFLKIHQEIVGRPVTFDEIDKARRAVKEVMGR